MSFGTDLVGDDYTGFNTPQPDADPMDCNGHGTHVAGIVAAQPNPHGFTGAAPDVSLGIYRVFGCSGLASTDILISAFNKAFEDGASIITASIVGANGWTEEAWAVVASRIVQQGVPCTISAGNDGDHGLFYISTAANGKGITAVAAYDNTVTPIVYFSSEYSVDGDAKTEFNYVIGEPHGWDVTLPLAATSLDTTVANDACSPLPDSTPDLSGKVVLVRRGTCLFVDKAANLVAKGAKYILLYNNVDGAFVPDFAAQAVNLKAVGMTTPQVGAALVAALKAGKKVTMSMKSPATAKPTIMSAPNNVTGGGLSLFTSWGPTWEMDFKPQIGGPGGNILSTYPVNKGSYAVLSGTSMSCPITAGIVALIGQVRGTLEPRVINDLLSSNANPQLFNDGTKFYSKLAPAAQQGGGLVQAYDSAYATSLVHPSSLSFNDTAHFSSSLNFTLSNDGEKSVTYSLGHVASLTMYTLGQGSVYPSKFPNEGVDSYASLKFSQDKLTLPAGHRAVVQVSPTPPSGLDVKRLGLWSGYVTINGTDGSSLSLPYQGLSGSLHDSTILAKDDSWMTYSNDTNFTPVAPNTTFVVPAPGKATANTVLPALAIDLALGSRLVRADIVPLTTCPPKNLTTEHWGIKTIGQPFGFPYIYNSRGVGTYYWDGKLDSGEYAPPGKYKIVSAALHIFGDDSKKSDYDFSETPSFRLKYE